MDKLCGICGEDCSDRPRVKDRRGRYFCKSCAMAKAAAGKGQGKAVAAASPVHEAAAPIVEDAYDLDDPGGGALPVDMLSHARQQKGCPVCMRTLAPDARICVGCGYDIEKGIQSSTLVEKAAGKGKDRNKRGYQCQNCGYNLEGLRDPVCPECGTRVNTSRKARLREDVAREVLIQEWRKPAAWFAVGFVGMAIIYAAFGDFTGIGYYAAYLGASVLVGYVVLWMCFNLIGDVGTPLLNLVRLAGIYALVDLVSFFLGFIPILIVPWVIKMLVYVGLFSDAFETDWQDAFLVIVLTGIAKFGVLIAVMFYLPDALAYL